MFTVKADNGKFVSMHPFYKRIVVSSTPKIYTHKDDAHIQLGSIQRGAKERVKHHKTQLAMLTIKGDETTKVAAKLRTQIQTLSDLPYREVADKIEKLEGKYRSAIESNRNTRDLIKTHKADLKRFEMISNLKLTIVTM